MSEVTLVVVGVLSMICAALIAVLASRDTRRTHRDIEARLLQTHRLVNSEMTAAHAEAQRAYNEAFSLALAAPVFGDVQVSSMPHVFTDAQISTTARPRPASRPPDLVVNIQVDPPATRAISVE
jgi:hypothetical protein